jgi:hypothetical protein
MDYYRECECRKSYGFYEADGLNAIVGGMGIPLGFSNPDLKLALANRPEEGMGSTFEAFVIPVKCPTIKHQK